MPLIPYISINLPAMSSLSQHADRRKPLSEKAGGTQKVSIYQASVSRIFLLRRDFVLVLSAALKIAILP
jgi:hypothetical protein